MKWFSRRPSIMEGAVFVTGEPGVGKSTVVERAVEILRQRGFDVAGVRSPEVREDGERRGFDVVDVSSGRRERMADVGYGAPSVGKYGVDVEAVDAIAQEVFSRDADVYVVDEVAPMEVKSDVFVDEVRRILDEDPAVLGVVHQASDSGLIGDVKDRNDVRVVEVTEGNRDSLPEMLADEVEDPLGS